MSRDVRLRVFCYDISDNRRRRRIATLLEDYATRVQESVFEARLSLGSVQRISKKVAVIMQDSDSLRVYTIGRTGERACSVYGQGIPVENGEAYWLV